MSKYICDWCGARFDKDPKDHTHPEARGLYIIEVEEGD